MTTRGIKYSGTTSSACKNHLWQWDCILLIFLIKHFVNFDSDFRLIDAGHMAVCMDSWVLLFTRVTTLFFALAAVRTYTYEPSYKFHATPVG